MAKKATKLEAKYQASPKGGEACKECSMYRAGGRCTAVEGRISPNGHCKYFERAGDHN